MTHLVSDSPSVLLFRAAGQAGQAGPSERAAYAA
jgi:hypothetical protein